MTGGAGGLAAVHREHAPRPRRLAAVAEPANVLDRRACSEYDLLRLVVALDVDPLTRPAAASDRADERDDGDCCEHALRLFVLDHRDLALADFEGGGGTDLLYDFLARWWGDAAAATMHVRAAALRGFFAWADDTDRIVHNPARRVRAPRQNRRASRRAHALAEIRQIVSAQDSLADEAFLLLMGRLALRKMEAACLRARDIDLKHDLVYVADSKTGERAEVPIVYDEVRLALDLWLREGRQPDERLLAPRGHPRRKPNPATVHRRFKRCLEKAGTEDFRCTSCATRPGISCTARRATLRRRRNCSGTPHWRRPRATYTRRTTTYGHGCAKRRATSSAFGFHSRSGSSRPDAR
jgi:integrase